MIRSEPRRPAREVELDDIVWQGVLDGADDAIDVLLKTHLALEAIVVEMLKPSQSCDGYLRWGFPQKTKFLEVSGIIEPSDKQAFDKLNDYRNDAAHIFGHRIAVADLLALACDLEALGVDFSDSLSQYTEDEAIEYYDGKRGILAEIGWCILFHAAFRLHESGGREIFSR